MGQGVGADNWLGLPPLGNPVGGCALGRLCDQLGGLLPRVSPSLRPWSALSSLGFAAGQVSQALGGALGGPSRKASRILGV